MPCSLPDEVFKCDSCECEFEAGVADAGPNGEPRCPQCGMTEARRLEPEDAGDFIVTRGTKFR